jgi:hypothetical protein
LCKPSLFFFVRPLVPPVHFQQFIEDRAVVNDGLSEILGIRIAALISDCDLMRRAIMLDHLAMIDR